jgi:isopentenyl-diphosphate delta-isomerase
MAHKTGKRKEDHIRICMDNKAQAKNATAGFEDIKLVHRALPEVNKEKINLSTSFLGKKFSAPIIVGAMTGGTESAININASIAQAVEKLGLGMGVGSQRAAIEDQKLEETFAISRKMAPNAFLIANIGGVQLVNGYGLKEVVKVVEMIDADAVAIHLNALQEAVQPEGQTNFKGVLAKIGEIASKLDTPVIIKETGAGISAEDAKMLENAGVKAIDVEYYRSNSKKDLVQNFLGESFWDWGIPTVASLIETIQTIKLPVIASGGVRSGSHITKALALNASLASISQPILRAAVQSAKETEASLSFLIEELRNSMFLVGAEKLSDLMKIPVVITGKTGEWLQARGFNLQNYGRRGFE